jgi:hypothetical protein
MTHRFFSQGLAPLSAGLPLCIQQIGRWRVCKAAFFVVNAGKTVHFAVTAGLTETKSGFENGGRDP